MNENNVSNLTKTSSNNIESWCNILSRKLKGKNILVLSLKNNSLMKTLRKKGINCYGIIIKDTNIFYKSKTDNYEDAYTCVINDFNNFEIPSVFPKKFDTIILLHILEKIHQQKAEKLLRILSASTNEFLFSFSTDLNDPTNVNIKQIEYFAKIFRNNDFIKSFDFEDQCLIPNTFRFIRAEYSDTDLVEYYERILRLIDYQMKEKNNLIADLTTKVHDLTKKSNALKINLRTIQNDNRNFKKNLKHCEKDKKHFEAEYEYLSNRLHSIQEKNYQSFLSRFSHKKKRVEKNTKEKKVPKSESFNINITDGLELFKGKTLQITDFLRLEEALEQRKEVFPFNVRFSILVPLYNTNVTFLKEMIDSVINQTYTKWELCLVDASDKEHDYIYEICNEYRKKYPNILYKKLNENKGISENTNEAIKLATGEFISLFDHDDILHPSALYYTVKSIIENNAEFVYTDETKFESDIKKTFDNYYKPDFAIDNLRSNNYICHFSSFKRTLLDEAGVFNSKFDGSQDHDLILRLTEIARNIAHVPKILYYWRSHKESVASNINAKSYAIDAGILAVKEHLNRSGIEANVSNIPNMGAIYNIDYKIKRKVTVSIIIEYSDNAYFLKRCIDKIKKSNYKNYEIIVVRNTRTFPNSTMYENKKSLYKLLEQKKVNKTVKQLEKEKRCEELERDFEKLRSMDEQIYNEPLLEGVKFVDWDGTYNVALMNNEGARLCKGEVCLFLHSDAEIENNVIENMLGILQREDVGVVGTLVTKKNNKVESFGITFNGKIGIKNLHEDFDERSPGYFGRLAYINDFSSVSGVCMMVNKKDFLALGGFSAEFSVKFYDVDLCLKYRQKNKLVVGTPRAKVLHNNLGNDSLYELYDAKTSLKEQWAKFVQKWESTLEKGDPYYNKNFKVHGSFIV